MPSMKCYQCSKIKRCSMYLERDQTVACDDHDACLRGPCKRTAYLCRPCARSLGHSVKS